MALTKLNNRSGITASSLGALTSIPDGSITASKLAAQGSILQTVEVVSQTQNESTTSSYVDIFSATITPSSASNRVLVYYFTGELVTRGSTKMIISVFRDSAILHRSTDYIGQGFGGTSQQAGPGAVTGVTDMFFDSPNTTSAVTYKVKYRGDGTSSSVGTTHQRSFFDGAYQKGRIILMEVI
jgi:hypothetical protein